MFTGLVIGGVILIAALIIFSYWCVYRAGREYGYEQCRLDKLAERPAARTSLVRDENPSRPAQSASSRCEQQSSRWYLPPPGPIRSHTSAADIGPVTLPSPAALPGPGRPQAARTSHPGTATLPRYRPAAVALDAAGVRPRLNLPATTGEMQAITDDWIANMQAEEEAHREASRMELTSHD